MKLVRELLNGWTWKMAWRDSRRDRRRLLLFSLSIVFGIAALVSIGSLRDNLQAAINEQAKELLGADLMVSSNRPYTDEVIAQLDKIPGTRIDETSFMTMLRFVDSDDATRLSQIRALEKGFPFYGKVVTEPASAWEETIAGNGIVMEQTLMDQYRAKIGDRVRIGELETTILGYLVEAPPRPSAFAAFAPSVYMSPTRLDATQLLGNRSMARYRSYYKIPEDIDVDEDVLTKPRKKYFTEAGIASQSIEDRKRRLGRVLDNLYCFLSLIGFMALVLGGIGIASAIHVHVLSRLGTVATLRCIGCTTTQAFAIFLIQGIILGLFGSLIGTGLGIAIQQITPALVANMLPFEFDTATSWKSIFSSIGIGLLLCVSFSLLPLIRVRRISPLAALRASVQTSVKPSRDPWFRVVVGILIAALLIAGFALSPQRHPWLGAAFVGGLAVALGILALIARGISHLARKYRKGLPYTQRQGLANLHRPRNQTMPFMIAIGLGVLLIVTMLSTAKMLSAQFNPTNKVDESNLFFIDVQPDQKDGVEKLISEAGMKLIDYAPMITMRLTHLKGQPITKVQANEETKVPGWILRRDFRSTFRDSLVETEELIKGKWIPKVENVDFDKPVPVSIDEGIAKDLKLDLDDTFGMDIHGLPMTMKITSIRKVDWEHMGLNFFLVFPMGILDDAPGSHIMTSRAEDSKQSAELQRNMSIKFPNVTVFDTTLILKTVESVVEKVSYVIRFMSLFTVGAGIIILLGTILSGQRDRVEESVLLRTLGASKKQIRSILFTEYFALGLFAALTGGLLAIVATIALAKFVFKLEFSTHLWPVAAAIAATSLLCAGFGMLLSRGVTNHPPLAILRGEK